MIARLLDSAPHVLSTGGGAFMDPRTRALIRDQAISVWLRADLDLLCDGSRAATTGRCCATATRARSSPT